MELKSEAKAAGRKGALHLSHNHLESNPPRPLPLPQPSFLARLHIFTEQHFRANPSAVTLITTVQRVRMVFPTLALLDSLSSLFLSPRFFRASHRPTILPILLSHVVLLHGICRISERECATAT